MSATNNDRISESAQEEQASSEHNPSKRKASSSDKILITGSASKRQREHDEQQRALQQLKQKVASLEAELKTSHLQSRQTECALCQESICSSCWVVDKCFHVYHSQCFLSLLLSNLEQCKPQRCPLCREQLFPLQGEDESYERALFNAILKSDTFITFAVKGLIRLKPEHFTAFLRQGDEGIFSRIDRIGGMFRTKWSQYKLLMSWMVELIVLERGESDFSVSMLKNLCEFCEQFNHVHETSSVMTGEPPASYFFQPEEHGTESKEKLSSMNGKTLLQLSVLLLDKAKNNMEQEMCFHMLDVLLHQKGVRQTINAQDDDHGTVLYDALQLKNASHDVVERCLTRLLQEGARPGVQWSAAGRTAMTALHICAKQSWLRGMLPRMIEASENVNLKNWTGQTALFFLFKYRSPMETFDTSFEELFFAFLNQGALLETRDRYGDTLLHLIFRHWTVRAIFNSKKILARLIHLHVLKNKFGYTPLDEPKDTYDESYTPPVHCKAEERDQKRRASFHTRVWGDVVYYEKEGRGKVDLYFPPSLDGTYQIVEGGRLVYEGRSKNGRLVCSYRSYRHQERETGKGEGNDQDVVRVLRRGGGVDIEERVVPYEVHQRFAHVLIVGMILSVYVMVVGMTWAVYAILDVVEEER